MNPKKVAFIICVNNELYFEECCWYINRLHIPESFEIDIISIREAGFMAEAYNAAMDSSDAKYKVYLHQDAFIYNQNFIADMVNIFQMDKSIGIMGMFGGINLPENGVIYYAWNCGNLITGNLTETKCYTGYQEEPYLCVEALDGLLLATQYDTRWREDILKQWDFYDVAQCFEFRKAGYKAVIPFQEAAWVHHDCGFNKFKNYNLNRKIMMDAYPEFFPGIFCEEDFLYNSQLDEFTERYYRGIIECINTGQYEYVQKALEAFEHNGKNNNLLLLKHISGISKLEKEAGINPQIIGCGLTAEELLERYTRTKFYLRRIEMGERIDAESVYHWIRTNSFSHIEILKNVEYNIIDKKRVLEQIALAYRSGNEEKTAGIIENYL